MLTDLMGCMVAILYVFAFVFDGLSRDRIIHRGAIIPLYFPLVSMTANAVGFSVLKIARQRERESSS